MLLLLLLLPLLVLVFRLSTFQTQACSSSARTNKVYWFTLFFLIVLFLCPLLFVAAPCFKFKLIPEFQGQSSCRSVVFPSQRARFHDAFKNQHRLYSHACNYLKANTAFIVSRIWSALMFSLKPFIQANITHVTMERSVLVNTKNKRKRHHRLNIDVVKIL